jgi:hypothetical protein
MDTKSPVLAIGDRSVMVSRTCPIRKAPWGADFSQGQKGRAACDGLLADWLAAESRRFNKEWIRP